LKLDDSRHVIALKEKELTAMYVPHITTGQAFVYALLSSLPPPQISFPQTIRRATSQSLKDDIAALTDEKASH
jgi:hypothetical protein